MNLRFIYNPKSGRGKIHRHIDYIINRLKEKYDEIDVYQSKSKEDLITTAKASCGKFDVLLFGGGDGTVNDIINAIAEEPIRPILGYLPSGTICDVARNLKIPRKLKKSLDIILTGKIITHDIGRNNNSYFMYVTGVGNFINVAYNTPHNKKKFFGRIAYYFGAFSEIKHYHNYILTLKINGQILERQTPLFLVLNTKSVVGFRFNYKGHRNDGTFDVYLVKGKKYITGLRNLISLIIFSSLRIKKEKISEYFKASSLEVTLNENTIWCNDGEMGPSGSAKIEIIPKHINILVDKNYDE